MLPQSAVTVGIDVAKDWLDAALPSGKVERFDNSPTAIRRLARWLEKEKIATVGLEPTGGYERAAVALLRAAGLQVLMVDSWRCRQFAKARGTRAKTDPLDARMIREFLLQHPCRPFPEPSQRQSRLTAWVREIGRAEADIRRLQNRDEHSELEPIRQRRQAEIATLRDTVALAEQEIEAILAEDQDLAAKAAIITSVPGLADKTARVVLAELPEIGSLSPDPSPPSAAWPPISGTAARSTGLPTSRPDAPPSNAPATSPPSPPSCTTPGPSSSMPISRPAESPARSPSSPSPGASSSSSTP